MYTYVFLKTSITPLTLPAGLLGETELVGGAELVAVVEAGLSLEQLQTSDDVLVQAVVAHDRVVRELFQQTTVLPLRFGTCFVSRQALLEHLNMQQQHYLRQLNALAGKAEYTLRLTALEEPEEKIAADLKGRDYFLAKKQQHQLQLEHQNQQNEQLRELMRSILRSYPHYRLEEAQTGAHKIYLLVDGRDVEKLYQQLQDWQNQLSRWLLNIEGGFPPYHFVNQ